MTGRAAGWAVVVGIVALLSGAFTASASAQVVLALVVVAAAAAAGRPRSWLISAALISFCSGLVRRLLAGPSGHLDNDPLVVLPLFLLAMVAVVVLISRRRKADFDWLTLVMLAVPTSEALAVLATERLGTPSLYALAAQAIPWIVVAGVRARVVPNVWPTLARLLPGVAAVVGLYGVVQFAVLPDWDRNWLVGLQASSLGVAKPFQVRIWGMSDSPGPYAALLGCCIVVMAHRAIRSRPREQILWLTSCLLTVVPLVLTGVRLALIGLAVCVVLISVGAARGSSRLLPLVVAGGAVLVVSSVVGTYGSSSTILTAGRLTSFNPATDTSVQARLSLYRLLPSAAAHPFGSQQQGSADGLFADVLLTYGPLAALFIAIAVVALTAQSIRQLRLPPTSSAPLVGVFLVVFSLGGSIFVSSTGTIASLAFGAIASAGGAVARDRSEKKAPEVRESTDYSGLSGTRRMKGVVGPGASGAER